MTAATRPEPRTMLEISAEAWGADRPDWVEALARACDETSQVRVGRVIGRSGAVISETLRCRYKGSLPRVEEVVRGALMSATVACPALGTLPLNECQLWRARSDAFQGTNSLRVRMFRACNRCPVKRAAKDGGAPATATSRSPNTEGQDDAC